MTRVNPVAYLPDDRHYMIWAANGGSPTNPNWYHNLNAQPNTKIEIGSETIGVIAEEATGAERERLWTRATKRYPQLIEAARKTSRVIPILTLTPRGKSSVRDCDGERNGPRCGGASRSAFIGGDGGHQIGKRNTLRDPNPVSIRLPASAWREYTHHPARKHERSERPARPNARLLRVLQGLPGRPRPPRARPNSAR